MIKFYLTIFIFFLLNISTFAEDQINLADMMNKADSGFTQKTAYATIPLNSCDVYTRGEEISIPEDAEGLTTSTLTDYNDMIVLYRDIEDPIEREQAFNQVAKDCRNDLANEQIAAMRSLPFLTAGDITTQINQQRITRLRQQSLLRAQEKVKLLNSKPSEGSDCATNGQIPSDKNPPSCNQFGNSLLSVEDNSSLESITELATTFMTSSDQRIHDINGFQGDQLFCKDCFAKQFNNVKNSNLNLWDNAIPSNPSEENLQTWAKDNSNFVDANTAAQKAKMEINDYLIQNLIKQELLKVSIVMEQYQHASGIDSNFTNNDHKLSCNNPEKLKQIITSKCQEQKSSKIVPAIVAQRLMGALQRIGMSNKEIDSAGNIQNNDLTSGLNYITNHVSTLKKIDLSPRDQKLMACQEVSRANYIKMKKGAATLFGLPIISKEFIGRLLSTNTEDDRVQAIANSDDPLSFFASIIEKELTEPIRKESEFIQLLTSKDESILTNALREQLEIQLGIDLPINLENKQEIENLQKSLPSASRSLLGNISQYNPNMFMFLNDSTVRKKIATSKDNLLNSIYNEKIDPEIFKQFSQKCDQAFQKLSELACSSTDLNQFSKADIIRASQDIAAEISGVDNRRKALVVIALQQTSCDEINTPHQDKSQLVDLDMHPDFASDFAQSDFMRQHKSLHLRPEDLNPTQEGFSEEKRNELYNNIIAQARRQDLQEAAQNPDLCNGEITNAIYSRAQCSSEVDPENGMCAEASQTYSNSEVSEILRKSPPPPVNAHTQSRIERERNIVSSGSVYADPNVQTTPFSSEQAEQTTTTREQASTIGPAVNPAPLPSTPIESSNEQTTVAQDDLAQGNSTDSLVTPSPVVPLPASSYSRQAKSTIPSSSERTSESTSATSDQESKRDALIKEILSAGDAVSPVDFSQFSDDELKSLAETIRRASKDGNNSKSDKQKAAEELKAARDALLAEREKLESDKAAFEKLRKNMHDDTSQSSVPMNSPRADTAIASSSSAPVPQPISVPMNPVASVQTSSDDNSTPPQSGSTEQHFRTGTIAGNDKDARRFIRLTKDQSGKININDNLENINEYLNYIEENALFTEPDAISFGVNEKNERVVYIPINGEQKEEIVISEINDPQLLLRIKALERTQKYAKSKPQRISPIDALRGIETEINIKLENIQSREKTYDALLSSLGIPNKNAK